MRLIMKIWLERSVCHCSSYIETKPYEETEELYEEIFDKYNGQFNLKYSGSSDVCSSQSQLDHYEKSEINVRTEALEFIGCLTHILWIYCNVYINFLTICAIFVMNYIMDKFVFLLQMYLF